MDREKVLSQIQKYLALTASSDPHEASAAMRKAQVLMRGFGVERGEILAGAVSVADARTPAAFRPAVWWTKTWAGLLLLVAVCSVAGAPATHLHGKVIHIDDGDTLILLTEDYSKVNVRLTDIDAPESAHGTSRPGQPFSRRSRESLTQLAHGKLVDAECFDTDRYRRRVCRVIASGVDINAEQVRRGMAWANRADKRYVRDPRAYSLEDEARASHRGLWASSVQPIAPWAWRKACWQKGACDGQGE